MQGNPQYYTKKINIKKLKDNPHDNKKQIRL